MAFPSRPSDTPCILLKNLEHNYKTKQLKPKRAYDNVAEEQKNVKKVPDFSLLQ